MPSKTKKQARLMAAVAHGWKPDRFKGPSEKVAKEFNQADEGTGILHKYAKGGMAGMVKPPTRTTQPPTLGHVQSPIGQAIQNMGNAGRYAGGMGLAPARPPRIPIQNTMRNIDATQKRVQLKALGGKIHGFDDGGQVAPPPDGDVVKQVVMTAMKHLEGMDASSAAAVLRSSPEAMSHPEIAAVVRALTTSTGITPATKQLNQISQAGSESPVQQTQSLRPPAGTPPQMPAGGPPQGQPQRPASGGMPQPAGPGGPAPGPSPMPSTNNMPVGPGR